MRVTSLLLVFTISITMSYGQVSYFPPNFSLEWETTDLSELDWCEDEIDGVNEFLEEKNTKAFIILKDGKIAMESYFDDHEMDTPWYWASAGKTLTSTLVGIAQMNGIVDINDPVSDYLGEGWTSCDSEEEANITIRNQLTMTTGLDYNGDLGCTEPECLTCLNTPSEEWYYHNGPYTLISYVIESASGQSFTQYTSQKLTNKLGFLGLWSDFGVNRVYLSTARGMARFGLFMLAEGSWNGEQIMTDTSYFQDMITSSQDINEAYGYLWWLNGSDSYKLPGSNIIFNGGLIENAPDDLYAAIGKNGQVCMVVPSHNLVIVRMGEDPDEALVPVNIVKDLWDQYEKLSCITSTENLVKLAVDVHPRLTSHQLHISSNVPLDEVRIIDRTGRIVMKVADVDVLDVSLLRTGIYYIMMIKGNQTKTKRFLKIR